jgi:acrylyl-CoA reductase (NADPH)
MSKEFRALLIEKQDDKQTVTLKTVDETALMDGNVMIDVAYSTLNYKDGLAVSGASPIVRKFPMIPGIDLVGTVTQSEDVNFKAGDQVLINGYGLSEMHCGGYAQKARVKSEWLVPLPAAISPQRAMAIGTAGYTAMLCVMAVEAGVSPDQGDILVTGAAGGVGSVAIAILSRLGYRVVASTGRQSEANYLKSLGAADVIDRTALSEKGRPLDKELWAGVVDSVGSFTLANALAQTRYGGVVAACGLAQGADLPATVMPFILRGVTLRGIDSVQAPMPLRLQAWSRLAKDLDLDLLDTMTSHHVLADVPALADQILAGQVRGRVVIDVNA